MPLYIFVSNIAIKANVIAYASPPVAIENFAIGRATIAPRKSNSCEILAQKEDAQFFSEIEGKYMRRSLESIIRRDGLIRQLGQGARNSIASLGLTCDHIAMRVSKIAMRLMKRHVMDHN